VRPRSPSRPIGFLHLGLTKTRLPFAWARFGIWFELFGFLTDACGRAALFLASR